MELFSLRRICVLFVCQSLIFSPLVYAEQLSLPANDLVAPEVSHEAINATLEEGSSLQLRATVTDNVEVKSVTLYYRVIGDADYKSINMQRINDRDEYAVTLGKQDLVVPGIEYYIQAFDAAGNSLLHGYSFSPLKFSVTSNLADTQAQIEPDSTVKTSTQSPKKKSNTWIWIGLGALAVGVIAAAAGGGGGSENPPAGKSDTTTITVEAPVPSNN